MTTVEKRNRNTAIAGFSLGVGSGALIGGYRRSRGGMAKIRPSITRSERGTRKVLSLARFGRTAGLKSRMRGFGKRLVDRVVSRAVQAAVKSKAGIRVSVKLT